MAKFDAILNIGIDRGEGEYRKKIGLYPALTARYSPNHLFSSYIYLG